VEQGLIAAKALPVYEAEARQRQKTETLSPIGAKGKSSTLAACKTASSPDVTRTYNTLVNT
jgi:hypothetical protein